MAKNSSAPLEAERPLLVDVVAAAKLLSISSKFLSTLARAGEVPSLKLHGRRLFSPRALEEWAAQQIAAAGGGKPPGGA